MGYLEKIKYILRGSRYYRKYFQTTVNSHGIILEIYTIIGSCILLKKIVKYRVILFILL